MSDYDSIEEIDINKDGAGLRIGIVVARFNADVSDGLLAGCTAELAKLGVRQADILIGALGRPHFLKPEHVRPGATVIDVGVNRISDPSNPRGYRLVGDVDFESVRNIAGAITPNPGGVGPMTIALLLSNTLRAAESTVS